MVQNIKLFHYAIQKKIVNTYSMKLFIINTKLQISLSQKYLAYTV